MFSEIVKISAATSRQNVRRLDSDRKRDNGNNAKQNETEATSDNATVSISALKMFLEKFVQNKMGRTTTQENTNRREGNYKGQNEFDFQIDPPKPSTAAARAASAYQSMAKAKEKRQILLETTDQSNGPAIDVDANDIRKIYTIIDDLKHLEKAKIEYIHIERAQSFIQSIENAVQKIENGLKL